MLHNTIICMAKLGENRPFFPRTARAFYVHLRFAQQLHHQNTLWIVALFAPELFYSGTVIIAEIIEAQTVVLLVDRFQKLIL